jgi:hypothetical protein
MFGEIADWTMLSINLDAGEVEVFCFRAGRGNE